MRRALSLCLLTLLFSALQAHATQLVMPSDRVRTQLNVRSGPTTSSTIVGKLKPHEAALLAAFIMLKSRSGLLSDTLPVHHRHNRGVRKWTTWEPGLYRASANSSHVFFSRVFHAHCLFDQPPLVRFALDASAMRAADLCV